MSYELRPHVKVAGTALAGWAAICAQISRTWANPACVVLDCYPGTDTGLLTEKLTAAHDNLLVLDTAALLLDPAARAQLLDEYLTDDRVFGKLTPLALAAVFDGPRLAAAQTQLATHLDGGGAALVIGPGARLVQPTGLLIYADMPRWEIQQRLRNGAANWLAPATETDMLKKYKAGYFIEWRIADRWKMQLFDEVDYFLDTTAATHPRLVTGTDMRAALASVVAQPFRVMPYFDPGVWGGQWLKQNFDLPPEQPNYAWGFDCVPEENSLLLSFAGIEVEVPSINVVLRHPTALLGEKVTARFGAEFPIRFDFLDTCGGGNLSLQVHPDVEYCRKHFGLTYTQDESYYILVAEPDAHVYLGFQAGVQPQDFLAAVTAAHNAATPLDVERFVNRYPAKQHDHFSIPAGTVHCAGTGCVILEISATPYIFTFKLWDWQRVGLDGQPRPLHLEHATHVLRGDHDTSWAAAEIINAVTPLAHTATATEERTGLHSSEFIETRRHWFSAPLELNTAGGVNVLNLVSGTGVIIESPTNAFAPMSVGFAETFILPAAVGAYRIVPDQPGQLQALVCASVRT